MEVITKTKICDRCKNRIEFHITNNIYVGDDVIKLKKRYGVTDHGEDWRDIDLCKKCQEDAEKFWFAGKEPENA